MPSYRDLWYQSSDGLRLYARDYPCRGTNSETPATVLCMHGLTRNSADFAGLAEHLSGHYRVLAVDQRGRGRSDYDRTSSNYTPLIYVQDMFTLLDQLQVGEVILIGTSMGGLMSLIMAAMQPARIRAIVLNDIGPEVDRRGLDRIKSYVGRSKPVANWDEAVAQVRAIAEVAFPDFTDQEWRDFARDVYREENGVPVLAYDPAIAQPMAEADSGAVPDDLWQLFDKVSSIPMLVVRGEHSDILSRDCVGQMRLKNSDLQVAEVPRRGHAPTLNEPVSREAIDAFFAGMGKSYSIISN
jgi:pimeloyl-ACP methyl ester carboxylesterase